MQCKSIERCQGYLSTIDGAGRINKVNVNINCQSKFFTWLKQQNYYEVHEGEVESQNYVDEEGML